MNDIGRQTELLGLRDSRRDYFRSAQGIRGCDVPQRPIFYLQLRNLDSNAYRNPILPSLGSAVRRRDTEQRDQSDIEDDLDGLECI